MGNGLAISILVTEDPMGPMGPMPDAIDGDVPPGAEAEI